MNEKDNNKKFDIFISYAHQDSDKAKFFSEHCKKNGFNTWLDEEKLVSGEKWSEKIEQAIKSSNVALVIISNNALSSKWVNREWSSICEEKWNRPNFKIIPINFENSKLPPFLCEYNSISTNNNDFRRDKLKEYLIKIINSSFNETKKPTNKEEIKEEIERLEDRIRFLKENLTESGGERGQKNDD